MKKQRKKGLTILLMLTFEKEYKFTVGLDKNGGGREVAMINCL